MNRRDYCRVGAMNSLSGLAGNMVLAEGGNRTATVFNLNHAPHLQHFPAVLAPMQPINTLLSPTARVGL